MNGIFAVDKPSGPSSADIISQIKKALNASTLVEGSEANIGPAKSKRNQRNRKKGGKQWWKNKNNQDAVKVGHGGTLDPLASGVVVVGVGEGTKKLTSFLTDCTKTYEAVAMFGVSTDTYDSTGKILEHGETSNLTVDVIKETIKSKFSGEILQFPPVYSALKMNGKPLYEYAREGLPLPKPIEPRKVTVNFFEVASPDFDWEQTEYSLPAAGPASDEERELILQQGQAMMNSVATVDLSKLTSSVVSSGKNNDLEVPSDNKKYPTLKLRFSVSSGTYIRSLIHDLAKAVGSTAHMTKLVRVQQGPFELSKNVFEFNDIVKNLPDTEWVPLVEAMVSQGPNVTIDELKKSVAEKKALSQEQVAKEETIVKPDLEEHNITNSIDSQNDNENKRNLESEDVNNVENPAEKKPKLDESQKEEIQTENTTPVESA